MSKVIDFEQKRQDSIAKRKRAFERILFKNFLGFSAQIDEHGATYDVQFLDISHDGCQFQIPYTKGAEKYFSQGVDITVRMHFTQDEFLPVSLIIRHAQEHIDTDGKAYWRYGGEFDKSLPSFQALAPFIDFIYKYAEFSSSNRGESKVYFL